MSLTILNLLEFEFKFSYGSLSLCSEPEAVDQPQPSGHTQAGDRKEYTQIPSPESVNLSNPQELAVLSQNKGELKEMKNTHSTRS